MADLSPVAADVIPASGATKGYGTFGATITQGLAVYKDSADSEWKIADCTTSAATAAVVGIALCAGSDGQPGVIHTGGGIDLGATLTVGETYVLSEAGAIAPIGDLLSNDYVTIIGVATAADNLDVDIQVSGVQVPA